MKPDAERLILFFADPEAFESWLEEHHTQKVGIWLQLKKKGQGPSLTYAQALDSALCYGWIDAQKAKYDDASYLQYFCPRRPNSLWSQVNQGHIERLTQGGRMRASGLAAIDEAKRSGRWEQAYQPIRSQTIPVELAKVLEASPRAKAFFESLDSQNRFAFVFRCTTPKKEETRQRKAQEFLRMLEAGEVFYPKEPPKGRSAEKENSL